MNYEITGRENTLESMIKNYGLSQPGETVTYYTGEHAPEHFPHMINRDNKEHMMLCALFVFTWNEMCDGKAMLFQRKTYAKKGSDRDEYGKFISKGKSVNSTRYTIMKRENTTKDEYIATFEKKKYPEILTKTIKKLS